MNKRFRNDADRLLTTLSWRESDQARVLSALEGEKTIMKKKVSAGFILAAVLTLLAAVALAVGLNYSARFTAVKTARQALMEKYHLTQEMVRLFIWDRTTEQNGETITEYYLEDGEASQFTNEEAMGKYTVTQDGKGNVTVTWSHDDVDPATWQNGDLSSPVWGAPQLQALFERYAAYERWWEENKGVYELPMKEQERRFEELYRLVAPLEIVDHPIDPTATFPPSAEESLQPNATPAVVPTEKPAPTPLPSDLPAEQLIALARQAMAEEYGQYEQELGNYEISVMYQYGAEGNCRIGFDGSVTSGGVILRPTDGEIQQVWLDSELSGNG